IIAHHVADDLRALAERSVGREVEAFHRVEHAPVHRLQTIAHIRQRPARDRRKRVREIALRQRLADRLIYNAPAFFRRTGNVVSHSWLHSETTAYFLERLNQSRPANPKRSIRRRLWSGIPSPRCSNTRLSRKYPAKANASATSPELSSASGSTRNGGSLRRTSACGAPASAVAARPVRGLTQAKPSVSPVTAQRVRSRP